MAIKTIQVPVIVGTGSKQTLVVSKLWISPPCPPVFRIKDIEKEVKVTNCKVIPGKVIINGFIDKNINYKTIRRYHRGAVCGPLFHFTKRIPFSTFIDIIAEPGEEVREGDKCEIIEAFVEGEKDELLWPVRRGYGCSEEDNDESETNQEMYNEEEEIEDEVAENDLESSSYWPKCYRLILEKDVVKIVAKVTRIEHCDINCGC